MCVWNPLFHMFFFTIVQLEHGDQASSDWPDPTKLGHWKGSGLRTLSHVPASFWIAVFGTVARAVKYRLVRYSGSIYVMFDHDWHTLTWRHLGIRRPEVLLSSSTKNLSSVCVCQSLSWTYIIYVSVILGWVFCFLSSDGPTKRVPLAVPTSLLVTSRGT